MRSPYRLIRDLHLYAGLFVSPFVLVHAIVPSGWLHRPRQDGVALATAVHAPQP